MHTDECLVGESLKSTVKYKIKFRSFLLNIQKEIFRAGIIGKKLITAGRTNSHLKDTYEELGRIIERKISNNELDIEDAKVRALVHTIKACKKDLKEIEEQVNKIRFSPAPEDISRRLPPKNDN